MPLVVERRDGVLLLLLDRPERRNAIDRALVEALVAALEEPASAVVLGSTDPRWFCAGADLLIADAERAGVSDRLYELYERMLTLPAPIVAAVGGPAVGGGAQLAAAADLRVAGHDTRIRFAGSGHGLAVGSWVLPSLVGRGRALDLCMTTREVHAAEALAIGLVDRVVDDPLTAAVELAAFLASADASALDRVKSTVIDTCGLAASLERERRGNAAWAGAAPAPPSHS